MNSSHHTSTAKKKGFQVRGYRFDNDPYLFICLKWAKMYSWDSFHLMQESSHNSVTLKNESKIKPPKLFHIRHIFYNYQLCSLTAARQFDHKFNYLEITVKSSQINQNYGRNRLCNYLIKKHKYSRTFTSTPNAVRSCNWSTTLPSQIIGYFKTQNRKTLAQNQFGKSLNRPIHESPRENLCVCWTLELKWWYALFCFALNAANCQLKMYRDVLVHFGLPSNSIVVNCGHTLRSISPICLIMPKRRKRIAMFIVYFYLTITFWKSLYLHSWSQFDFFAIYLILAIRTISSANSRHVALSNKCLPFQNSLPTTWSGQK